MLTYLAIAQATGGASNPMDTFPLVMLFGLAVMYFMVIRPQQQKSKEFGDMVAKIRRGDTVVTSGGFVCRVSKVSEGSDEIEVELNDQMKVRVLKSSITSVRSKNEPVKDAS